MKLEVGKKYKTRGGDIVYIDNYFPTDTYEYRGRYITGKFVNDFESWASDGSFFVGKICEMDLVEEVTDEHNENDDPVSHPKHYTNHPSGIECIDITRHMGFNLGNAIKYIWRCDLKRDAIEDLEKAVWYIQDEIKKRKGGAK